MSLSTVTHSLGLPPAPSLFAGDGWRAQSPDAPLPFFDLPAPPEGAAPDPDALYAPPGEELYDYQVDGARFLMEHPVALLGDEMGLGKSIQAISALRLLIRRGEVGRALILCPKTLIFDWYYKLRLWAPDLRVVPVEGPRRRRQWYWRCQVHVHLVGYESWREDLKAGLASPDVYDLIVLDEVQRIKNPGTAIHKAVAQVRAPWRWGLSGTPLENRVEELLAIFAYLKPGLLPGRKGCPVEEIHRRIAPYVLRRRKADVLRHLPPKEHRTVWLDLTPAQRMAYEAAERAAVAAIRQAGHAAAPVIALTLLNQLKQLCNLDPATGASCKLAFLEQELAPLVARGEKAVIFSQYPKVTLEPLLPRLEPFGAVLFDGSLSDWKRQLIVHHFQHGDMPRVLAMSLKAGGVGITLTRANHVYHLDHWWNPAVAQQAEDRTHRIGQRRPVFVTTLLTRGTVEERIAELVERKRELFHEVMDPLTEPGEPEEQPYLLQRLSRAEILSLFGVH
ncbi:DEAD/DEAH box helicase [Symbiobacterium thermophilum]|uniref:DEAD/DEAH box helicase n=1 Tax=Symbiobacterium thermophilum TaxID=2734 RepID=UPI0003226DE0|nr:DEAD/DEAH box helicase [Symbiobacterium thermophilum]